MSDSMTLERPIEAKTHEATAPASKAPRITSEISGGTVTLFKGAQILGAYSVAEIADQTALAAIGLRYLLVGADEPGEMFAQLVAGKIPGRGPKATKELEPWRLAYAHTLADENAKTQGVKTYLPGGRNHTQEFTVLLDDAKQRAVSLDKSGLAKAKTIPGVVAHHARITGAVLSAASLVA